MYVRLFCVLVLVSGSFAWDNVCYDNVYSKCESQSEYDPQLCNSRYSGFINHLQEIQGLLNLHLQQSYQYLLMSSHFGTQSMNRLGFQKFFQGLSDSFFEDSFKLINYINLRGGHVYNETDESGDQKLPGLFLKMPEDVSYDLEEVKALAYGLDLFKHLATRVHDMHKKSLKTHPDSDLATFLEVHFIQNHSQRIRELAGLVADLEKMARTKDYRVAVYLFDQFLLHDM